MAEKVDMVVRGGTIVDGSGGEPFEADIVIADGRIVAIEGRSSHRGAEEIDARGKLVTPGFVDLHTHYDGQATWDSRLAPHRCTASPRRSWQLRRRLRALPAGTAHAADPPDGRDRGHPQHGPDRGHPVNWESYPDYLSGAGRTPV